MTIIYGIAWKNGVWEAYLPRRMERLIRYCLNYYTKHLSRIPGLRRGQGVVIGVVIGGNAQMGGFEASHSGSSNISWLALYMILCISSIPISRE
jgi:hypothetical protein